MDKERPPLESKIDPVDLEIWKKVVDVQMHFNDLELRVRNYAIISLGAIMTVAGYALKEGNNVYLGGIQVPAASIFLYLATIVWLCFWFMDRHWYHRLLLGAVKQGMNIEEKYRDVSTALALSAAIKEESPNSFLGYKVRSQHRLNLFYWAIASVVFELATLLWSWSFAIIFAVAAIILAIIIFATQLEHSNK